MIGKELIDWLKDREELPIRVEAHSGSGKALLHVTHADTLVIEDSVTQGGVTANTGGSIVVRLHT